MPEEVRRLRAPWPSRVGEADGLTPALEKEFRFGQRVSATERGFLLGGTMKGGSSSMWLPVGIAEHQAFLRWRALEGFSDGPDTGELAALTTLLKGLGIALTCGRAAGIGEPDRGFRRDLAGVYALLLSILRELPADALRRAAIRRIQIGGWGPDAAKASAYDAGTVYLYDFAVRGARRTCAGLVLHELGHAHEHALAEDHRSALRRAYAVLAPAGAFYAIEYLLDAASRVVYQRMAFEEFVAETHLAYTACGGGLRAFIDAFDGDVKRSWRLAHEVFQGSLGGVEYE